MSKPTAYGMFTHPDGEKCIWLDETQEWFVPLDAGGEGYTCEKEHPRDELLLGLRAQVIELETMVSRFTTGAHREEQYIWIDPEDGTQIVWSGSNPPQSCILMKRYVTDWSLP